MKKVLPLAIAAALVAPAAAMADATVFGKVHMIVQDYDNGSDSVWSTDSVFSRVGVKGSEDLGDGLKAVYHLEFGVNPDASGGLSNRNQFVGLAGGFGTFLAGRHDTPLKMSQGKFDEFGDLPWGDITRVMPGEDRLGNVLAYVSPNLSGLTIVGAAVAGERGDNQSAANSDLTGLFDHYSIAGLYSNGPIFASLAYNGYDTGNLHVSDPSTTPATDVDLSGYSPSILRATFVWDGGNWQAGAMYSKMSTDDLSGDDVTSWGLSGHFMVTANDKVKAQYLSGDAPVYKVSDLLDQADLVGSFSPDINITGGDDQVDMWSIGYEHAFSKRTYVHVGYTSYSQDSIADDQSAFFGGLVHSF
jgi:predicted porin